MPPGGGFGGGGGFSGVGGFGGGKGLGGMPANMATGECRDQGPPGRPAGAAGMVKAPWCTARVLQCNSQPQLRGRCALTCGLCFLSPQPPMPRPPPPPFLPSIHPPPPPLLPLPPMYIRHRSRTSGSHLLTYAPRLLPTRAENEQLPIFVVAHQAADATAALTRSGGVPRHHVRWAEVLVLPQRLRPRGLRQLLAWPRSGRSGRLRLRRLLHPLAALATTSTQPSAVASATGALATAAVATASAGDSSASLTGVRAARSSREQHRASTARGPAGAGRAGRLADQRGGAPRLDVSTGLDA